MSCQLESQLAGEDRDELGKVLKNQKVTGKNLDIC